MPLARNLSPLFRSRQKIPLRMGRIAMEVGVTLYRDPIVRVCLNNRAFRNLRAYHRVGIRLTNMYDNFDMPSPHNGAQVRKLYVPLDFPRLSSPLPSSPLLFPLFISSLLFDSTVPRLHPPTLAATNRERFLFRLQSRV